MEKKWKSSAQSSSLRIWNVRKSRKVGSDVQEQQVLTKVLRKEKDRACWQQVWRNGGKRGKPERAGKEGSGELWGSHLSNYVEKDEAVVPWTTQS